MQSLLDKYHTGTSKTTRWFLGLLLVIVFGVLVASVYYRMYTRKRELERLRTEAEIASIKANDLRHKATQIKHINQVAVLAAEANSYAHQADLLRAVIIKKEKELDDDLKQVESLKSWKSLDAYNQRRQPPQS